MKAAEIDRRSTLIYYRGELTTLPVCPICNKPVHAPSMHEYLITRGHAKGAPFEEMIQIFVPWNVILLHEGPCHIKAQFYKEYKEKCLKDVLKYFPKEVIKLWLLSLSLTKAKEILMELENEA